MNFFKRAKDIVDAKVNKFLDGIEDPNEMLDLSYEKMLTGLQKVKSNLADVVTEVKALENQMAAVKKEIAQHEEDAKTALKAGREDLAQKALERKQNAVSRLETLKYSCNQISEQAEHLKDMERKYQDKITDFKTQKEVTKATYKAAEAQVRVSESMAGVGKSLGNVGDTLQRANDKADKMMARAQAMESLSEEGILNDPLDHRDATEKELDKLRKESAVNDDMERLKKELGLE